MIKLPSNNITFSDVANILNISRPINLSDLCYRYNYAINICSLWKPVIYNSTEPITLNILQSIDYGLKCSENVPFWTTNKEALIDAAAGGVTLNQYHGGSGDWYYDCPQISKDRIGDFRNYVSLKDQFDDYYYCINGTDSNFLTESEPAWGQVKHGDSVNIGIGNVKYFSDITSTGGVNPAEYLISPLNLLGRSAKLCCLYIENETGNIGSAVTSNYVINYDGSKYWFTNNVLEHVYFTIPDEGMNFRGCLCLIDDNGYMCLVPRSGFYFDIEGKEEDSDEPIIPPGEDPIEDDGEDTGEYPDEPLPEEPIDEPSEESSEEIDEEIDGGGETPLDEGEDTGELIENPEEPTEEISQEETSIDDLETT